MEKTNNLRRKIYNKNWMISKRSQQRQQPPQWSSSESENECDEEVDNMEATTSFNVPNVGLENHYSESDNSEQFSDSTDSYMSDRDDDKNLLVRDTLKEWALLHQVTHCAVDDLLKRLKKTLGLSELPSTARTLLQTCRDVDVKHKSGMEYVYIGFTESVSKILASLGNAELNNLTKLEIGLNVDGLPLFKSTKACMWPILCALMNIGPSPIVFPIALTYGKTKPENLDFLNDTMQELVTLSHNGLIYNDQRFDILIKFVVCDAPARSFVKGTKLYSGYSGCDHCTQHGIHFQKRMTFPDVKNLKLRDDYSFRRKKDKNHHHKDIVSPFCSLSIDMVQDFPIDFMHQSCLGVMKKLLLAWVRDPDKKGVKMSAVQKNDISTKLLKLQRSIPRDFARKPRSLDEIDYWKATELRQFLLYTGKIVLKHALRKDLFEHFMYLSVALCILLNDQLVQQHAKYAYKLLLYFVDKSKDLYGPEFVIYNVHCLVHLPAVAQRYGNLDRCSGFCFENYLHVLKRKVRSGRAPLSQVAKRISEMELFRPTEHITKTISIKKPNNAYFTDRNELCEILDEDHQSSNPEMRTFRCRIYPRTTSLFEKPCDSRLIGVHVAMIDSAVIQILPPARIKNKAFLIIREDKKDVVFMALLHEYF